MGTHRHNWMVYSTALVPPTILVHCAGCGRYGHVTEYTTEEWNSAFYAPTNPYPWTDDQRVTVVS